MSAPQLEIQLIAVLTAVACAIPGVFLVLRRMAMMSDAISHSILPGIALAFFITEDLSSPLLIVGAALTGVFTVWLVELIYKSGNLREDASMGLVFPVLWAASFNPCLIGLSCANSLFRGLKSGVALLI